MTGAHTSLQGKGWKALATSDDFTSHYGHMMRPGSGGTTSKTGGVVDYVYASPGFIPFKAERQEQKSDDFTRDPAETSELIAVASANEGSTENPGVSVNGK